ncbi:hypothetical protein GCM10017778_07570 [Streptomyces vinaceus]|nr:hypothetical protein GCM10017778_07570 [Streptomyces vinaceus]
MAQAQFGQEQGGVPVGHAGVGPYPDAGFREGGVEVGAGGGVLREPDVADAGEVGRLDAGPDGKRVVGADGEHPGQLHHRALLDPAHGPADGDPGEVQVVGGEGVEAAAAGILGLELQADPRVAAPEADDGLGHEVPYGRGARGDAYRSAVPADEFVEAAQGAVEPGDAVRGGRLEDAPGLGGEHAAGVPLQQLRARLLFEAADVLADRGLRTAEIAGDGAEAAGPADGDEDAEIVEGHGRQATPSRSLGLDRESED